VYQQNGMVQYRQLLLTRPVLRHHLLQLLLLDQISKVLHMGKTKDDDARVWVGTPVMLMLNLMSLLLSIMCASLMLKC
jgi:hypothetical protein